MRMPEPITLQCSHCEQKITIQIDDDDARSLRAEWGASTRERRIVVLVDVTSHARYVVTLRTPPSLPLILARVPCEVAS